MPPKIFATGTTGYLGGDVLFALLQAYPSWESNITCLVRNPSRGNTLSSAYPNIKVVYGTLDDNQILEEEASKADIVLHWASSDHIGAANAIKKGLERGNGGYWIHTSGTDILLNPELLKGKKDTAGMSGIKVYDDWDNIKEVITLPDPHSHRLCDKIPLSLAFSQKVKTAIVCPPTIWGRGRGTGSTRSHQIYGLANLILERGSVVVPHLTTTPKTFWPNVHVYDLSRLYLNIIDSAVTELQGGKGAATWGTEGYYFAENGVHYWQDVAAWLAEEADKQSCLKGGNSLTLEAIEDEKFKYVGPAVFNCRSS
ncbi:hypothetical protein V500_07928, partial [Pseudogymnoascus sp. VKM F-4518 (FW-2643)]